MSYCPNCGSLIQSPSNYCPNCGFCLTSASAAGTVQKEEPASAVSGTARDLLPRYDVVLVRLGSCSKTACAELIQDMLGCSSTLTESMLRQLPVLLAANLTESQAMTIAQAFCEYGADMTVYTPDGAVDLAGKAVTPVFDDDSAFTAAAAATLATLTAANCVRQVIRWDRPDLYDHIFRTEYRRPAPPRHMRRRLDPPASPRPQLTGRPPQDMHRRADMHSPDRDRISRRREGRPERADRRSGGGPDRRGRM